MIQFLPGANMSYKLQIFWAALLIGSLGAWLYSLFQTRREKWERDNVPRVPPAPSRVPVLPAVSDPWRPAESVVTELPMFPGASPAAFGPIDNPAAGDFVPELWRQIHPFKTCEWFCRTCGCTGKLASGRDDFDTCLASIFDAHQKEVGRRGYHVSYSRIVVLEFYDVPRHGSNYWRVRLVHFQ
jgi:hypothetical protein